MIDLLDSSQRILNTDFFETTLYQQLIVRNESKIFKNDVSQKLFEYNHEISHNEFFNACEQARKSFCVFRTRFFYNNKLIQIVDEYDPSIEIVVYVDIEKEENNLFNQKKKIQEV